MAKLYRTWGQLNVFACNLVVMGLGSCGGSFVVGRDKHSSVGVSSVVVPVVHLAVNCGVTEFARGRHF